ncbi:MAG: transcriptional regulator [Candidatus Binatia bacterium]|nr:MAG: transcriptional regulator [Candidatus Binatia bacterium]
MKGKVLGLDRCVPETHLRAGRVPSASIDPAEAARLSEIFRLLGDPTRTRILYALARAQELCVCELASAVGASETAVSHALRLLRAFGIVRSRRSGRLVYYALDDEHVRSLLELSLAHLRHGRRKDRGSGR